MNRHLAIWFAVLLMGALTYSLTTYQFVAASIVGLIILAAVIYRMIVLKLGLAELFSKNIVFEEKVSKGLFLEVFYYNPVNLHIVLRKHTSEYGQIGLSDYSKKWELPRSKEEIERINEAIERKSPLQMKGLTYKEIDGWLLIADDWRFSIRIKDWYRAQLLLRDAGFLDWENE